ncbi:unnamed protein product [Rotaria sp. Silwood1]|nr:unnamed protein product [Rotaria sp. Silwood1]
MTAQSATIVPITSTMLSTSSEYNNSTTKIIRISTTTNYNDKTSSVNPSFSTIAAPVPAYHKSTAKIISIPTITDSIEVTSSMNLLSSTTAATAFKENSVTQIANTETQEPRRDRTGLGLAVMIGIICVISFLALIIIVGIAKFKGSHSDGRGYYQLVPSEA